MRRHAKDKNDRKVAPLKSTKTMNREMTINKLLQNKLEPSKTRNYDKATRPGLTKTEGDLCPGTNGLALPPQHCMANQCQQRQSVNS